MGWLRATSCRASRRAISFWRNTNLSQLRVIAKKCVVTSVFSSSLREKAVAIQGTPVTVMASSYPAGGSVPDTHHHTCACWHRGADRAAPPPHLQRSSDTEMT